MHPLSFLKNPVYAIIAIAIFALFLFFPIILIAVVAIFYVYDWVVGKSKKQTDSTNYDQLLSYVSTNNSSNKYMSAADKRAYLSSPKWKALRQQVLARDNHRCVISGRTDNLHIHHIHYNNLGDEQLSDLITLNANIHQDLHNLLGYDRNGDYSIDAYLLAKLSSK